MRVWKSYLCSANKRFDVILPKPYPMRIGSGFTVVPLLWLLAIDAALIGVGATAFQRRDLRC